MPGATISGPRASLCRNSLRFMRAGILRQERGLLSRGRFWGYSDGTTMVIPEEIMKAGTLFMWSASWLAAGALPAILAAPALAQEWKPDRPVEIVATNAPGGGSDRIGRII